MSPLQFILSHHAQTGGVYEQAIKEIKGGRK
jgi:hypothetical protein